MSVRPTPHDADRRRLAGPAALVAEAVAPGPPKRADADAGSGHDPPCEAPQAFVQAVPDLAHF